MKTEKPPKLPTDSDSQWGETCAAPVFSAVPSHARLQDDLDWKVFAKKFQRRNGFEPHRNDSLHREYFEWFTTGAHAEYMGLLYVQPNA